MVKQLPVGGLIDMFSNKAVVVGWSVKVFCDGFNHQPATISAEKAPLKV